MTSLCFSLICMFAIISVNSDHLKDLPKEVDPFEFNNDLFDVVENMKDSDSNDIDLQEYIRKMMLLVWRLPFLDLSENHRYDSLDEKLVSGGSKANAVNCNKMLRVLIERITSSQINGSSLIEQSTDYRLFNLLDSFGRPEGSFLRGVINWLGDYDQCLKAKYDYQLDSNGTSTSSYQMTSSRYCLAHVRWQKWKTTVAMNEWAKQTVKSAICLPETCDSLAAEEEENKQMISELMNYQYSPAYKNFKIGRIYCLPDPQSPLTQLWHDLPATCCAIFFSIWIFALIVATGIDLYKRNGCKEKKLLESGRIFYFIQLFSFIKHTEQLFAGPTSSEDGTIAETTTQQTKKTSNNSNATIFIGVKSRESAESTTAVNENKVSLRYLHCVKVVFLFTLLKGHYFLGHSNLTRIYDLSQFFDHFDVYQLSFAGLAVNIFLMITGMLTAYIMFDKFPLFPKENQQPKPATINNDKHQLAIEMAIDNSRHALLQPLVWIGFCSDRYLKIVPIWFLWTLIPKYMTKHLGSGPMWFYGTSSSTNYHDCQQQSWHHLFLGIVNWRPVISTCLASEWYLAVHLQCAILVTPLLIMAYIK